MPKFQDTNTRINSNGVDLGGINGANDIFGGVPVANVFTPGAEALYSRQIQDQALNQAGRNAENITAPEFSGDSSVQAGYSGDLNPQMYGTPESAQYSLAQDSAEGRSAQLAALQEMGKLTDQSAGSQMALGRNQADMDARQLAQSREGAIRQDAMRRGQVGGAADMLARQQSAQAASNQNLNAGLQNANQAALMELAGTQAGSSMAGQMRGQDQALAFNNADTINRFNLANTAARNAATQGNTQMQNAANLRNLDAQQGFMDRQTGLNLTKLQREDKNKETGFGNQMAQEGAVNDVLNKKSDAAQQQAQTSLQASQQGAKNFQDLMKMIGGGGGGMGG